MHIGLPDCLSRQVDEEDVHSPASMPPIRATASNRLLRRGLRLDQPPVAGAGKVQAAPGRIIGALLSLSRQTVAMQRPAGLQHPGILAGFQVFHAIAANGNQDPVAKGELADRGDVRRPRRPLKNMWRLPPGAGACEARDRRIFDMWRACATTVRSLVPIGPAQGDAVYRDEGVRTRVDSKAALVMEDKTNVSIGPSSTLSLTALFTRARISLERSFLTSGKERFD